jgi:hypothetical protein
MAELNFIEYNVNPTVTLVDDVVINLRTLGFNKISVTKDAKMSMWSLNKCILLVNTDVDMPTGITGLGFNTPNTIDGSKHCETTGLSVIKKYGLNIYTYPVELFRQNYEQHFTPVGVAGVEQALDFYAGVVINSNGLTEVNNISDSLKLKIVKRSEEFITSVCENNRFNILWRLDSTDDILVPTLIIKTDSISDVVAKLVVAGYDSVDVTVGRMDNISKIYTDDTEDLLPPRHFIEGWQLNLSGKPKSYVLEKKFTNILPNLNIIVSERHNHNGVNEESVIYYAEQQPETNSILE